MLDRIDKIKSEIDKLAYDLSYENFKNVKKDLNKYLLKEQKKLYEIENKPCEILKKKIKIIEENNSDFILKVKNTSKTYKMSDISLICVIDDNFILWKKDTLENAIMINIKDINELSAL